MNAQHTNDYSSLPVRPEVHASGCVVWRITSKGRVKVLVVHRPHYDDWSFPKGKRDPGESDLQCALRETAEEVNAFGDIGAELCPIYYFDNRSRPKVVRYWTMRYTHGDFTPNDEVDEVRWLSLHDTAKQLTYLRDGEVLESFRHYLITGQGRRDRTTSVPRRSQA